MTCNSPWVRRALAVALAGALVSGAALADKGGKGHSNNKQDNEQDGRKDVRESSQEREQGREQFGDAHRTAVHDYYGSQMKGGHCPPGLAKKHNGCMPPGQARKWEMGRPLPRDVVYYEIPRRLT